VILTKARSLVSKHRGELSLAHDMSAVVAHDMSAFSGVR
jgi:hypothetical protein